MQRIKTFLKALANNDYVRRVFHTFWQAAFGVLLAGLVAAHSSHDVTAALVGAFAAGLAAVKAYVVSKNA